MHFCTEHGQIGLGGPSGGATEAWPNAIEGQGQILHLIDEQAVDHALISMTVAASGVVGAQSSVTMLSARGSTAPL